MISYMPLVSLGVLLPFFGTALGSAAVFVLRLRASSALEKCFLGFASGVMLAASVWSLILPALEILGASPLACLFSALSFLLGALALLLPEALLPLRKRLSPQEESCRALSLAVTLHNLPEGMAVGAALSAALSSGQSGLLHAALLLSFGVAVQNLPEGAIISLPEYARGVRRGKSFLSGVLSGAVEPLGALATLLLSGLFSPLLPFLLLFAAGAMVYAVAQELLPRCQAGESCFLSSLCACGGFALMMALDVMLG